MKKFIVPGHEVSLLPEGKKWKMVWSDEFDGTELDTSKWDYRLYMSGKRHKCWGTDGVKLDGASNVIFSVYEKDGIICSSQLQTGYNYMDEPLIHEENSGGRLVWPFAKFREQKYLKKYGYFECRCKLQKKEGWWSAFWMQSPIIGSSIIPEISGVETDIMESFHVGEIIPHTNHYNGYGADHKSIQAGNGKKNISLEEYHRFGMLWDKNGYTFFVDGEEDGHIDGPVSHVPQFILISTEIFGYRTQENCATEEAKLAVGDTFTVDYVRVFDWDDAE